MLRRFMTACVALSLLIGGAVAAQDIESIDFPDLNKFEIPEVEKITLDNGMRLYLLQDKALPLFNSALRINCGTYLDPADKVGLGDLCFTVMRTGGTKTWTGDEIDALMEGIGGSVETNISDVQAGAFVNVLSDYTDTGLTVLAEVLRYPQFAQDKIDLAMVQARTNISRRNDDVSGIALREYRKLIYGEDSPYARTTEYATLENISREDMVAFHQKYVRPENIQMAIWGDFDKDELLAKIEALFGDWEKGTSPVPPPPEVNYQWRSKLYYAEKPDAKQSYIRMGHLGGLVMDEDYPDILVMNSVLGLGFGSRLTDEVRTRLGLAYTAVGRYINNFAYPGYFFALASTGPENTVKAARAMMEQIASMHTVPPTDLEMKKAKEGYLNSFVFNFDTRREIVSRLMGYDFYGIPKDFLQTQKERVEQVTKDDVVAAAKRNLHPDEMIVLIVGNKEQFDMSLDSLGLGEAEMIDISIPPPPSEQSEELVINDENVAKGKELLMAAAEAHGGKGAFDNISTISSQAEMKMSMGGQEFNVPISAWQQLPDMEKSEVNFMGRRMVTLRMGDQEWQTNMQTGELAEATAAQMEESAKERMRGTIRVFKALDNPYYKPVYNGTSEVDGTPVEWVALVDESGEPFARLGINAENHTLAAKSYHGQTMQGEGTVTEVYSDIKDVSGVKLPMSTVIKLNGEKVMEYHYQDYSINTALPADVFAAPE